MNEWELPGAPAIPVYFSEKRRLEPEEVHLKPPSLWVWSLCRQRREADKSATCLSQSMQSEKKPQRCNLPKSDRAKRKKKERSGLEPVDI